MIFQGRPSNRTTGKGKRAWIMKSDEKSCHFVETGRSQQRTVILWGQGTLNDRDYRSIEPLDNAGCTMLQPNRDSENRVENMRLGHSR